MNKMLVFFSLFTLFPSFAAVDLLSSLQAAKVNNETIKMGANRINQQREINKQNHAAFYPKVNLIGNYTHQEWADSVRNSSIDNDSYYLKLNATQSLFKGFYDFYNLKSSKNELFSKEEIENLNRLNLYSSVAQQYYSILILESNIRNLKEQRDLYVSRSKELIERVKIGKSRKADLLSTQAQIASTNAQVEANEAELIAARENFANLTKLNSQIELKTVERNQKFEIKSLEYYLDRSEKRPDILSLKHQLESLSQLALASKASRLPSLDLIGNYFLERTGTSAPSKWDVGLTLSLPLFEAGVTSSQIQIALEKQNEKSLILEQTRKNAQRDIEIYYKTFLAAEEQIKALDQAIVSSQAAYQEHLKDYRFGLSTLLDVLQAQNSYLDAKKNYERLIIQSQLIHMQLLIAIADGFFEQI